jgi:hypothetical protein
MVKARLWFARVVMGYALLIFAFLGQLFFLDPMAGIASFGVTPKNIGELTNEGLSTLLFIIALLAYPRAAST